MEISQFVNEYLWSNGTPESWIYKPWQSITDILTPILPSASYELAVYNLWCEATDTRASSFVSSPTPITINVIPWFLVFSASFTSWCWLDEAPSSVKITTTKQRIIALYIRALKRHKSFSCSYAHAHIHVVQNQLLVQEWMEPCLLFNWTDTHFRYLS